MKKTSFHAFLFAALICSPAWATTFNATLLVNFSESGDAANPSVATAASDFAVFDSDVDLSTAVNELSASQLDNTGFAAASLTGNNISADFGGISSPTFGFNQAPNANPNNSAFDGLPIFDGYAANGSASSPTIDFEITGIEELALGTDFVVTIYAVGDVSNQGSNVTLTYDGISTTAPQTNAGDADGIPDGDEFAQFTLTKTAANSISVSTVGQSQFHAVNGFSITGTSTVPEPSSFALLSLVGLAVGTARRRR